MVNIGGMLIFKDDDELFRICQAMVVPLEGFPTYGGLAGRDMERLARGLQESVDDPGYFRIAYCIDEAIIHRSLPAWEKLADEVFAPNAANRRCA